MSASSNVDILRTKSILAQFTNAIKYENQNVKYALDEDNINIWYVLLYGIVGNKEEFTGGEFLFRIHIPTGAGKSWLTVAPRFIALTPNGVYEQGKECCIHIGEFHEGSKVASLGVGDFVVQLMSGMIAYEELKGGINLIYTNTNPQGKRKISNESIEYNKKHFSGVLDMINRQYDDYSKKFVKNGEKENSNERIGLLMTTVQPSINPRSNYDMNVNSNKESNGKNTIIFTKD